jgi:hypothetical protein
MPRESVRELHLAGFTRKQLPVPLLIDTHSAPVDAQVWALYAEALDLFGPQPTLIEWDQDIPELEVLLAETGRAQAIADERLAVPA